MMNILGCLIALFMAGMFGFSAMAHAANYRSTCRSLFWGKAGCLALPIYIGLVFSLIVVVSIILDSTPKYRRVSPSDVYGTYRIDRKFYPGKNADWQYKNIDFTITGNDRLVLMEFDDKGIMNQYTGKLTWSDTETRRALWSAKLAKKHHLRLESPILYRSYFHFYYVIRSDKYGNMFFRRESDYPIYEFGFTLLAIPATWYFRYHKRQAATSGSV